MAERRGCSPAELAADSRSVVELARPAPPPGLWAFPLSVVVLIADQAALVAENSCGEGIARELLWPRGFTLSLG